MQHLFCRLVDPLPLAGELELLLAPVDQQDLEMALHGARLLADRRLGQAVQFGRFRKTFGFHEIGENFEIFNLHDYQRTVFWLPEYSPPPLRKSLIR